MGSNPPAPPSLSLEVLSHYFPQISAPVIADILQQADSEMLAGNNDRQQGKGPVTVNWDARDVTVLQHLLLLSEGECSFSFLRLSFLLIL